MQCNFGRVIPNEEVQATKEATNEITNTKNSTNTKTSTNTRKSTNTRETANETAITTKESIATNGELAATDVETAATGVETATTGINVPVMNTAETPPTEPVEDDRPKLPLWKAALQQRKEAEVKKRDEEQKKLVSNLQMEKLTIGLVLPKSIHSSIFRIASSN